MNVLFVNYGDFTTNSLNHIAGFARGLGDLGHACAVAVPEGKETLAVVPEPRFLALTYAEALERPGLFPDGRPADLIHAWTPREGVRKFVLAYQARAHARLIVHLEDNEEFLTAAWFKRPVGELRNLTEGELAEKNARALAHPRRYRHFLRAADGVTVIVESLRRFVPEGVPVALLRPGLDFAQHRPQAADPALRREIGLAEGEKAVVLTGSNTFANEAEMAELYEAIALLNRDGPPTRLVRTGFSTPAFEAALSPEAKAHVLNLGFVEKARLPRLLALADALVQPGRAGPFNDFRLPSKLPEFLSAGKPVVLPDSNLGLELRDGEDALVLRTGAPAEIAEACRRIFGDPALAEKLGRNAAAFARRHFDLAANTKGLAEFYAQIAAAAPRPGATSALAAGDTELTLSLRAWAAGAPLSEDLRRDLAEVVAALERQEQAQGELRRLEAERDDWRHRAELTERHTANLEQTSRAVNQRARNTSRQIAQVRAQLRRLNEQLQERDNSIEELKREMGRLEDRGEHLEAIVADREKKIRAMQESFSWRSTQPLRALRRQFIDPRKRPPSPPPPSLVPTEPAPALPALPMAAAVDQPQSWHLPPRRIFVGGWCFAEDGRKLTGVRGLVSGRTVEGLYGLQRRDVMAALRGRKEAEHSGWQMEIDFQPGDTAIEFEARDESGAWHRFHRAALRIGEGLGAYDSTAYEKWIEIYGGHGLDGESDPDAWLLRTPLISVVMPVYNTPERWLRRAIESVQAQLYRHWELCIADDASTAPHVRRVLEEAAAADPRLKVCFRQENGHISAASNSALELAGGEFVALLDHDDELSPDALFEVAAALDAKPQADYLYSDEDKIDEDGRRHHPYFKPDWDPDLFAGQNYTSHLSVYRLALVRAVGGFRRGYEGSQDWDLALRVVERSSDERIVHISKVLYHWRAIPGSTAVRVDEKNYSVDAAHKALTDHFAYRGERVELLPVPGHNWRVKRPLPSPAPLVSLIIPTRNGLPYLRRCVDSILEKTTYPNFELLVVDNGSDDPDALAFLRTLAEGTHPGLRAGRKAQVLRYDAPFNYSAINNFAVEKAGGELLGFLNNDLEAINADWLEEMAAQALRPEIGCVGAMLYYPNDTIQHAGVVLGLGGVAGHAFRHFPRGTDGAFNRARLAQSYSAVTAACLVVRAAVFRQVGGFDQESLAVAFNDIDFCLKVRAAGYRNLWTPFAELYHHESVSRGAENTLEKMDRFRAEIETMLRRWGPLLHEDPAYNPNLTLDFPDFSLASPPRLAGL